MFRVPAKELVGKRQGKVRQSNALIRSKQPLDLMQKRLFYLVLETIRTTDTEFDFIEIPDFVLRELLSGTYGSFREDLKVAADGLVGTSFSLMRPTGGWTTTPIFDRIEYVRVGETTELGFSNTYTYDVLRAKLHKSLEPHLLRLEKNYNTQDLLYVLTIPRIRAHRLYEILLHESFKGKQPEVLLDIKTLQAFLGVEKNYERWQDFKRTLSRNQEIIHAYTDMRFTFEGTRSGRKVESVTFNVTFLKSGDVQGSLEGPAEPQKQVEIVQLANELRGQGYVLDPYVAIEQHGVEKVRHVLKKARAAQKGNKGTKSEIHNPGGLIKHLLENTVSVPEEPAKVSAGEVQKVADELREGYRRALAEEINALLSRLSSDERESLLETVAKKFSQVARHILEQNKGNRAMYEQIRNTTIVTQRLLDLPAHLASERCYFDSVVVTVPPPLRDQVRAVLSD
jgi:hypothetical protein